MVISFSKFKNGCGGATGGTVSGITLWSADYTREYIDSVVSGYTKTEDFATINGSAITEGGNIVIQGGSGGTEYSAGTNIDITNNVISVTGITVPTDISDLVDDIGIATTAWTNSAISGTMSSYTPTSAFTTINGSAITEGGNIIVEGTPYSGGTGIGIENHIVSVTGDYETVVELTQAEYDALTAYSENTTYIITDAPAINMSAYTPTSGFSTINGSAITEGGNIVIEGGSNYSAGTNIDITNDVISVTGITVPTKLSDLTNDAGFITQSDIPTSNTAFTNDAGYVNSGEVETQITSKDYPTKNWVQGHVSLAVSGKLDTNVFTPYTANTQTELDNKQDASAMTQYATTAFTESTYLKEHQSLSAYSTTEQVQTLINTAKQEVENEIPDVSDFVTSAQVNTQIESKGYITGYTETDPVFMSSPASGITANDITNWNGKLDASALTPYYTSAQTDTAISNAVSGKVDTSTFEQAALYIEQQFTNVGTALDGKVDTSAMTEYYTSAETETAIQNATNGLATEQYVDNAIEAIDIPTVPTNVSEFVNDAGYITSDDLIESGYTTQDYVDNALTETNSHIDNMEEMTATALLDLKTNKADATALTEYAKAEHVAELEQVTSVALNDLNSNKADVDAFTAYTPTSGFATINGSAITEGGNIVIQGGGSEYSAGTNIDITNNVISVTGITVPTTTSELTNDSGFITSAFTESTYEKLTNKVTSISSASTDTQYPSAKCVYDMIGDIETLLASI